MFSRRVFECLASFETVLSSPSVGMEAIFGDTVSVASDEEEARQALDKILTDQQFKDKQSLKGWRIVAEHHTYTDRLQQICADLSIFTGDASEKGVSIVTATNRPQFQDSVFENFVSQAYSHKELIIVLNNDAMNLESWREKANQYPDEKISIFQLDEKKTLGECLNFGFAKAQYPFLTKFDDDDYYAPLYLSDQMRYFDFTDADVIGKCSYHVYYEALGTLGLRFANHEHLYHSFFAGATMVMKKDVFDRIKFPEKEGSGEDTSFIKQAVNQGFVLYATDRFNYLAYRRANHQTHTWQVSDEEHIKKCQILGQIENPREYVTVPQ
jgi:hypothetical protein